MSDKMKLDPRKWSVLPEWDELPDFMRTDEVRPYYNELCKHCAGLKLKRVFDVGTASVMLIILAIPMGVIGVAINADSKDPIIGARIRGRRFDELPQLFDVIEGTMLFVGTRPEAVKYVKKYTPEMMATYSFQLGLRLRQASDIRMKQIFWMLQKM